VTPEAGRFVAKASELLDQAETMLGVGLNEAAGRTAYLAGFHAAQAFVYESTGKVFKSHKGVHTEFLRLTNGDPRFAPTQRMFLSQTYNLKRVADYETGPGSEVTAERAASAVEAAKKFISHVTGLI
jgi:uncharacterized protein (UPF0332 family)